MDRVKGKVAIVTGAASGVGRKDALLLVREGARVTLTDIDEEGGRAVARVDYAWRMLEGMETGWTQSIDRLGELVAHMGSAH